MDATNQGLSVEWLLGTGLTLLVLLINPEQAGWRIGILATAGLVFLNAVRKSQWAQRTNLIITLNGESFAEDGDTFLRKLTAYAFVVLGIAVLGLVTWPSRSIVGTGDEVIFTGPETSQIQYHPTPNGILTNEPNVQSGAEKKQTTGRVLGTPGKDVKPPVARPSPPRSLTVIAK
jgi:hypothetical protein